MRERERERERSQSQGRERAHSRERGQVQGRERDGVRSRERGQVQGRERDRVHNQERSWDRDGNRAQNKKKKKRFNLVTTLIMIIAAGVFVFSLYQLVSTLLPYLEGRQANLRIRDGYTGTMLLVDGVEVDPGDIADGMDVEERFFVDFEGLLATNPRTVAWIRFVEPAIISYPVVHSEDNLEYLSRSFYGDANQLGTIFMDYRNTDDFSDKHTLIYGHSMSVGGEMFSQLHEFAERDFIDEYPYFYIHTPDGLMRTYRIFMVAVIDQSHPIYSKIEFDTDEDFMEFLELSRSASSYFLEGPDLDENAEIVTLSTCTNIIQSDRFIVQGVLVDTR